MSFPASRPPTIPPARDLSNAEFKELDGLLAGAPEPLDVVTLDGYLCGVLVQPRLIESELWLAPIFGVDGSAAPDSPAPVAPVAVGTAAASARPAIAAVERTRALIERRYAALNRALAEDGAFDPFILELDPATEASESAAAKRAQLGLDLVSEPLLPWVAGFRFAIDSFDELSRSSDEAVQLALARIYRHLPAETDEERAVVALFRSEHPLRSLDAAIVELIATVADLYDLTSAERYHAATVKRETPKLGRNEPCWCGSGKKFKQCHGASAPTA